MFFEPYAIEVANRIDNSAINIALELASGTGRVTRHLRRVLSSNAKLIASDVSEDMLAIAKEKLRDENIDWQMIDAQKLPFNDNSVDVVVCCFGYMFVADKILAFSEAKRVLRKNGMLLFTTWDKLETAGASFVYRNIAKMYLPDPLPECYSLPFSMHDEVAIRQMLQDAGFSDIKIERSQKLSVCSSAKEAAESLTNGGAIYNELMNRDPASIGAVRALTEKMLAETYGTAPMVAPMSALITQAWK